MRYVSTEEPAQGQGPQESDSVQHADAPEERQAEGEVRFCRCSRSRKIHFELIFCRASLLSGSTGWFCVDIWSHCKEFNLKFVFLQGSNAPAEEVPKAVWCPSEVGPEIPGIYLFMDFIESCSPIKINLVVCQKNNQHLLINSSLIIFVIFKAKMSNICLFQLLASGNLLFFFMIYNLIKNTFGLWGHCLWLREIITSIFIALWQFTDQK